MKKKLGFLIVATMLVCMFAFVGCSIKDDGKLDTYSIKQIDLTEKPAEVSEEYASLYGYDVLDDTADYLAHPDSVLLEDGKTMVTYYPTGHGKGAIRGKKSTDGKHWEEIKGLPPSWKNSMETPTVYPLHIRDNSGNIINTKYILISANPTWSGKYKGNGFSVSLSEDGITGWTEFQTFYGLDSNGKKGDNFVAPIVAMASLTQLKENGKFVNRWMGFFHDEKAYNYKTILSFDEYGYMQWSAPEKYFAQYRDIEKKAFMCEVEVVRSNGGQGDELCLLGRANGRNKNKEMNTIISFSTDEGKTWSEPKQAPMAYNGERHKAEYLQDGRLFITFRSIDRSIEKLKVSDEKIGVGNGQWFSEGWIGWVGTYEDLKNGTEGQYRVKLAHTYLNGQTKSTMSANGDTGYSGNVVMQDGRVMTCSYGKFKAGSEKTFIASKVLDFKLLDQLVKNSK